MTSHEIYTRILFSGVESVYKQLADQSVAQGYSRATAAKVSRDAIRYATWAVSFRERRALDLCGTFHSDIFGGPL